MFFGSIIVGVFAALWFWMGMRAADSGWAVACLGVPISALTMAATYWRVRGLPRAPAHERRRIGRVIGWASLFEGIAIFVAVNVVTDLGHADLVLPAIAIIVGLHFLPMAYLLGWRNCYWLATAMAAVAICPHVMLADPAMRDLATGTGAACALWVFCWLRLLGAPSLPTARLPPRATQASR
jgi:hypothetical protein